jgi:hypothetical protein
MTVVAANLRVGTGTQYRKAITAGVIGNVLEWYDFGVAGRVCRDSRCRHHPGDPVADPRDRGRAAALTRIEEALRG